MPYIYSLAYSATMLEENIMYPLFLDNIDDKETYTAFYQYMFGKFIMIAPIYEESGTDDLTATRNVYFPDGIWYDVNTMEKIQGRTERTVTATIDTLPMYYREGAIIPMMKSCNKATDCSMKNLDVLIIPSENESHFVIYDDDGESYEYTKNKYNSVVISQCKNNYGINIKIETQNCGLANGDYFKWNIKVLSDADTVKVNGKEISKEKTEQYECFEIIYTMRETILIEMN